MSITLRIEGIAYEVEMLSKGRMLTSNFDSILGAGMHCPRCLLRGEHVRWFPVRQEEWQVSTCVRCDYQVMDR